MYGTALKVAQQTAAELGLPLPDDLVTSVNETSVQLYALMNAAGAELLVYNDWQNMLATATITTVAGQALYTRPTDFLRQVNQTIWDKTNTMPVPGSLSPKNWQTLINGAISSGPFTQYRIIGDKVELNPVPGSDGLIYTYNYMSQNWVQSGSNPNVRIALIQSDNDSPLFDFWLMVKFLKLKFWQAKGLDTTTYTQDFQRLLNTLIGQDVGGQELYLSGCRSDAFMGGNVPEGSWQP